MPDDAIVSLTCPRCGKRNLHPKFITEGYCGWCHDWTGIPTANAAYRTE